MKKLSSLLLFALIFAQTSFAQEVEVPDLSVTDVSGKKVNLKEISNSGKPVVLAFWATWCAPCIKELSAVEDQLEDWKSETNVDFYGISVDDSKSTDRVKPMVNGKGWSFDILLDPNGDVKRLLNVPTVPHVILVKNGKIVYRHIGYQPGSESELYEKIKEYSN